MRKESFKLEDGLNLRGTKLLKRFFHYKEFIILKIS